MTIFSSKIYLHLTVLTGSLNKEDRVLLHWLYSTFPPNFFTKLKNKKLVVYALCQSFPILYSLYSR